MDEKPARDDIELTTVGPVVVRSPMGVTGPDGLVVLYDTDPYRPSPTPNRFEIACTCGELITVDVGRFERGVRRLTAAAATGLGLVETAWGWRGARDLDVSSIRLRHHDTDLIVVMATGEAQPGRDMVVLHGVAEVAETPVATSPAIPDEDSPRIALAAFVAAGLAVLALVGWIHWSAISGYTGQNELERSGVSATALVVDARADTGTREVDEFVLDATFVTAEGRTIEADYRVDENTFRAAAVGSSVDVRYDPDDPSRSVVESNDAGVIGLAALVTVDVLLIVLALTAWWATRRSERAASRA